MAVSEVDAEDEGRDGGARGPYPGTSMTTLDLEQQQQQQQDDGVQGRGLSDEERRRLILQRQPSKVRPSPDSSGRTGRWNSLSLNWIPPPHPQSPSENVNVVVEI